MEPWGASELQVKSGEVYIGSGELELAQGGGDLTRRRSFVATNDITTLRLGSSP